MLLNAGDKLGPYEILGPIGAGGMGEVYRARDPRMGREVAIKVSAERFSDRFEREVRAVAALNHPNICQVYDVGPTYLVMELVEGPTLADRIRERAVPLEEALAIARQIGDALESAHEKGIVHRDLKPANVKVKPDGAVKVLDFGLAKVAAEAATAAASPDNSPTLTVGATQAGQILGTAAYMSPEQARGKTVDKRADIWAFGVVLYEMLTGRRLFEGETISDTLAGVLTKEPDWTGVPLKAQRLLKSCLEKEPKRRLRDIGDAWCLLDDAPVLVATRDVRWKAAAGALTAALAISLWAPWRGAVQPAERPSPHLDLDLGSDVSLDQTTGPSMAVSPDGTRIVFVSQDLDGTSRLYARSLEQGNTQRLPGTEGAYAPFFSPDGQWVGFFASGKLKKTRTDGSEPVALCDAPSGRGASWSEDGSIIAALNPQMGLSQVSWGGGEVVPLTSLAAGEDSHRWPQVLPGGKFVLFTFSRIAINFDDAGIAILSLKDRRRKNLLQHAGMYPRYITSGHVLYATKGSLFAAPFDLNRLEITGAAVRLEEASTDISRGFAQIDISQSGMLALRSGGAVGLSTFAWLNGPGQTKPLTLDPGLYTYPRISPDGTRIAYVVSEGSHSDLFVYDWRRGINTRLTKGHVTRHPLWSPDGRFLVYESVDGMSWIQSDGAGTPQQLTRSTNRQAPNTFHPDRKRLAFTESTLGTKSEIRILPVQLGATGISAGEPQSFVKTASILSFPVFSPDGRWLAYANSEGGPYEVYVRAFPDQSPQVQVSNAGGTMPYWSGNGRELFYRTEDQRIMVAEYSVKGEAFIADKPRVWFGKRLSNVGLAINLDLAADGRFIVLMPAHSAESRGRRTHMTLVMNFFDEVRRRLAAVK
jgi:serine/threonine-protein kinase